MQLQTGPRVFRTLNSITISSAASESRTSWAYLDLREPVIHEVDHGTGTFSTHQVEWLDLLVMSLGPIS